MNPPYGDPESVCTPNCTKKRCKACTDDCKNKRCGHRGYHLEKPDPGTIAWFAKMHEHRHGIGLQFARTGNTWFQSYVAQADAVFFFNKRIRFVDRTGEPPRREDGSKEDSPGADSMLVAWGPDCVAALYRLERAGHGYVFGRHRSRWEAIANPPSRLGALRWIPFLPEVDLEALLDIIWQWRRVFGEGPSADTETQVWAAGFHRQLGAEKKGRPRRKEMQA